MKPFSLGLNIAVFALLMGTSVAAQSLHVGARFGFVINFPGTPNVLAGASLEGRDLLGGFGVRALASFGSGIAIELLYRFTGDTGPLYFGAGLGMFARDGLEGRVLAGYAYPLSGPLEAFVETTGRFLFSREEPILDLTTGLTWRF